MNVLNSKQDADQMADHSERKLILFLAWIVGNLSYKGFKVKKKMKNYFM